MQPVDVQASTLAAGPKPGETQRDDIKDSILSYNFVLKTTMEMPVFIAFNIFDVWYLAYLLAVIIVFFCGYYISRFN